MINGSMGLCASVSAENAEVAFGLLFFTDSISPPLGMQRDLITLAPQS